MNASRPFFQSAVRSLVPLIVAPACALLAGCVGNPFHEAKIDPSSPVAPEVANLTHHKATFPTFANIPQPPKDVRPVAQFGKSAASVVSAGNALLAATEPNTWTLKGTDAFAARAQKDVGPQLEPPAPSDSEALARKLRERATPPPPR